MLNEKIIICYVPEKCLSGGEMYYKYLSESLKRNNFDNTTILTTKIKLKPLTRIWTLLKTLFFCARERPKKIICHHGVWIETLIFSLILPKDIKLFCVVQEKFFDLPNEKFRNNLRNLFFKKDIVFITNSNLMTNQIGSKISEHTKILLIRPPVFDGSLCLSKKNRTASNSTRPTILSIGTIQPRKQTLQTITAVKSMKIDASLNILGSTSKDPKYFELCLEAARGTHKIQFQGQKTSIEVYDALLAADLLVHLASPEAFGNVMVEALACGVPVLCRDTVTEEIKCLEHVYPLIKESDCERDIKEKIEKVISSREKIPSAYRAMVEKQFTVNEKQINEYINSID